jgi:hypothetical protein
MELLKKSGQPEQNGWKGHSEQDGWNRTPRRAGAGQSKKD